MAIGGMHASGWGHWQCQPEPDSDGKLGNIFFRNRDCQLLVPSSFKILSYLINIGACSFFQVFLNLLFIIYYLLFNVDFSVCQWRGIAVRSQGVLQVGGAVVPRLAGQYVVTSRQWH